MRERNYRAVLNYDDIPNHKNLDIELLKSIASALEELVNRASMKPVDIC